MILKGHEGSIPKGKLMKVDVFIAQIQDTVNVFQRQCIYVPSCPQKYDMYI